MREIKFRGKRCDNGDWVYGYYVESNRSWKGGHPHKDWILDSPFTNGGWFALQGKSAVVENTVGQFVGTCDKNGNRIYEGDIVRGDHYPFMSEGENNYLGVVFFSDEDLTFEIMLFVTKNAKVSGISNFINTEFAKEDGEHYEVIGNIFDKQGLFRDSDEDIIKWFVGE